MTDDDYELLLDALQEEKSGIGPTSIENIRETFPNGDDFVEACRDAYETRDTTELERIDGIGHGYALSKLARFVADQRDWEGGDAEPIEIPMKTGADIKKELEDMRDDGQEPVIVSLNDLDEE